MKRTAATKLIRARVEAFIRDFAKWNAKFYPAVFGTELLEWDPIQKEFVRTVSSRHFMPGERVGDVGCGVGSPPEHSPRHEKIILIDQRSETEALVETKAKKGGGRFYEYAVRWDGNEWQIARLQTFFAATGERVTDVALKALARSRAKPLWTKGVPAGLERSFKGGASLRTRYGVSRIKVVSAGVLEAPSGFLACDDPGEWQWGAAVLEIRIPPGKHEVDLVIDDNLQIVGAARVVFDGRTTNGVYAYATRRYRTRKVRRSLSHIVGVDGGMVGLGDAGAIIGLSRRERERLYWRIVDAQLGKHAKGAVFVPIDSATKAIAIDSGCGDGGYEAFWKLDRAGRPLELILDFADLALAVWDKVKVPFTRGRSISSIGKRRLRSYGVSVHFGHEGTQQILMVRGDKEVRVKIFDTGGNMLFGSEGGGCSQCDNETRYYLPANFPRNLSGHLELEMYMGHRYEFG
ncbi:MAG: DUF4241 domain-containing protein [Verrucomicrobia subdivision 3 bacterium]|nr:DUF4241 domain-containing protein [Limisphaerales bacterium]